jgi:transporter family-2 protein
MNVTSDYLTIGLVGLLGGLCVGLQGPMFGVISQRLGPMSGSLIIHTGGAILSAAILLIVGGEHLREWTSLPAPFFLAGAMGVILYVTLSVTLPRIGVANATVLIVAGQFVVALLLDQKGWMGVPQHPLTLSRLAGFALLLGAVYLMSR